MASSEAARTAIPLTPARLLRSVASFPLYLALLLTGGDTDGLMEWWKETSGGQPPDDIAAYHAYLSRRARNAAWRRLRGPRGADRGKVPGQRDFRAEMDAVDAPCEHRVAKACAGCAETRSVAFLDGTAETMWAEILLLRRTVETLREFAIEAQSVPDCLAPENVLLCIESGGTLWSPEASAS